MKILLVEDEPNIADFVVLGLSAAGFHVRHAADGAQGMACIAEGGFDVVILDVMLPHFSGTEILRHMREKADLTPVIVLSAKSELHDRLLGFEVGADDYMAKPFFVEELVARIKAVVARKTGTTNDELVVNGMTLNRITRQTKWQQKEVVLSQREFTLLEYLMRSPGHIFSRAQILKNVWGFEFDPETNVVDVCVKRLKAKLTLNDAQAQLFPIESVRGVGYRFKADR